MKIYIPNSAFLGNLDPFLRSFDPLEPERLDITSNPHWISVHPVVLSMIASLGIDLQPENITCEYMEATSKHYLKRMGLFDLLHIDTNIQIVEHEAAGRFIPLTQITDSAKLTSFITEVIPLLHVNPEQAEPIRYILSELTRNVFEHAQSSIGAIICAQYYKKSNTIKIGIVDRGIGIKKSMSYTHTVSTDSDAIRLALTPGVTGTTSRLGGTEYNAGAGLFFIKSIAKVNQDFFLIYSGKSMYKLLKTGTRRLYADPFKDNHSISEDFPYWQGTVVGVDINLNQREEFANLLEVIRQTFAQSIYERRKEIYKKPRFI